MRSDTSVRSRPRRGRRWWAAVLLPGLLIAALGGCKEKEAGPEVSWVEGVVEKIDLGRGVVTVRYYSDKHKTERTEEVHVTDETEVMINGVLADLSDVQEGERASACIRVQKRSGQKIVTIVQIKITRSAAIAPSSAPSKRSG